jgi:hypothetical protein
MNMRIRFFSLVVGIVLTLPASAQIKRDTVKIPLAKTSQIIFTIGDKSDLETLKHYNFQELFSDILTKLEKTDSSIVVSVDTTASDTLVVVENTNDSDTWRSTNDDNYDNSDDNNDDWKWHGSRRRWGRTWQSFNFDLGTNNYLENGKFTDSSYAVKPWGSWYIAINSTQRSRLGRNFFLEWAVGVSWYSFKMQNANTVLTRADDRAAFIEDTNPDRSYTKSKLGITYVNASIVPVIDFSDHHRKPRMWSGHSAFRIGLGPYIGYRISSLSKVVYKEDGDREKDKDRSNFYLNNLRYGARLQVGFRSTDFFFNYDLNDLFSSGKGPELNAISFGVIF